MPFEEVRSLETLIFVSKVRNAKRFLLIFNGTSYDSIEGTEATYYISKHKTNLSFVVACICTASMY